MIRAGLHWMHDPVTSTLTYITWDRQTRDAIVIDPLLEYDVATQTVGRAGLERLQHFIRRLNLQVHWILETHVHADHLSAAQELKAFCAGARIGCGERVVEVATAIQQKYGWPAPPDLARIADRFFGDGEEFTAGSIRARVLATPGHTPACVSFVIGERVFTGDTLMNSDFGTGRCDFPGGSARDMYLSIWGKLFNLPAYFRVYPAHDYARKECDFRFGETVQTQREVNKHLRASTMPEEFVKMRLERDQSLPAPELLELSLRWNLGMAESISDLPGSA